MTPSFLKGDHLTVLTPELKSGIDKPLLNAIVDTANSTATRNEPSEQDGWEAGRRNSLLHAVSQSKSEKTSDLLRISVSKATSQQLGLPQQNDTLDPRSLMQLPTSSTLNDEDIDRALSSFPWPENIQYLNSSFLQEGWEPKAHRLTLSTSIESYIVPVARSNHWTLLQVQIRQRLINHYDSLSGLNTETDHRTCPTCTLMAETVDKALEKDALGEWSPKAWTFKIDDDHGKRPLSRQQENSIDCGVFLLHNAHSLSLNRNPWFDEPNISELRGICSGAQNSSQGRVEAGSSTPHSPNLICNRACSLQENTPTYRDTNSGADDRRAPPSSQKPAIGPSNDPILFSSIHGEPNAVKDFGLDFWQDDILGDDSMHSYWQMV